MTQKYMESKKYLIQNKKQFYRLVSFNDMLLRNNSGWISIEIILLSIVFQKYYKKLVFNVVNMASHNIVLGVLWLRKYNLQINWKWETLTIKYECVLDLESCHQLNTVKDEGTSWKKQPKNVTIFNPKLRRSNQRFTVTDINQNPLDQ